MGILLFLTITVDITARMRQFIIEKSLLDIIMIIKIKYSSKMYDHKNNENNIKIIKLTGLQCSNIKK